MVFVNPWLMFINKHDSGNAQHALLEPAWWSIFWFKKMQKSYKYIIILNYPVL